MHKVFFQMKEDNALKRSRLNHPPPITPPSLKLQVYVKKKKESIPVRWLFYIPAISKICYIKVLYFQ